MRRRTALTSSLHGIFFLLLGATVLAGCPAPKTEKLSDEPRVTSKSEVFTRAARALTEPCNNPAEFGRCGCFMDGLRTSCDLVLRCLEVGFCTVAQAQPQGTTVKSQSTTFSAAARDLAPVCNISAEFGRCGCFLDGFETPCSVVNRCLDLGFCVRVAAQ
jgi:hypothetical protein